jgi:hypothetical protein
VHTIRYWFRRPATRPPNREREPFAHFGQTAHHERAGCHELTQAGRDPGRVTRAGAWQQEPELVAAHTGDQAVAPDMDEQDLADDPQDLVADVVPVGVVDALEMIDIGHHEVSG